MTHSRSLEESFDAVLGGHNFQIIQFPHPVLRVYAQNADGHAALLISGLIPEAFRIPDGKGYTVKLDRSYPNQSIALIHEKRGTSDLFLMFASFILQYVRLNAGSSDGIEAVALAVREFNLFSSRRTGRLSMDEIRGLFAELFFLQKCFAAGFDQETALNAWRGPYASRGDGLIDFVFPNGRGIEIKSSQQPPIAIHVASPEQLTPRETPIFLAVVPIEEVTVQQANGLTLLALIEQIENGIKAGNSRNLDIFRAGLAALGLDTQDEYYDQWRFLPGGIQFFEVGDGFPTLSSEHIPSGVIKVSFSLLISVLKDFKTETELAFKLIGAPIV